MKKNNIYIHISGLTSAINIHDDRVHCCGIVRAKKISFRQKKKNNRSLFHHAYKYVI